MKRTALFTLTLIFLSGSIIAQEADTSKVRIGKKKYTIIVDDNKDVQIITDHDESTDSFVIRDTRSNHKKKKHVRRMDGMWEGIEFGFSNFANSDYGFDLPSEASFMDLDMTRSWAVNLNFAEKSLGIVKNYFGLVTGLGFEYNRYMLSNPVKIAEVNGQMTGVPVDLALDKNRLSAAYLNIPLMAEFQIPVYGEYNRIHVSGGVVGGVRVFSRQVQKYKLDGDRQKMKTKDDFNLRDFRYGFTARVGYGDWAVFANYYPQTLFKNDLGPDIYPITFGIHIGS